MTELATMQPAGPIHRVGRFPNAWEWPRWEFAGPDGTFGNRWDDPNSRFRVLYSSRDRRGSFVEVLARFRPDPILIRELRNIDRNDESLSGTWAAGVVPAEWLDNRTIGSASFSGLFADLGSHESLACLHYELADLLTDYSIDELDASVIKSKDPRRFTQDISAHIFDRRTSNGHFYAGLAYGSRFGDDLLNFAVYEETEADRRWTASGHVSVPIAGNDPDLCTALVTLGLELELPQQ